MFRQHDQRRPRLIQARVHAGSDLDAAGQRQTNVNAVAHLVRDEGALDFIDDFFVSRNLRKRERFRGTPETGEMFVQFENAAVIEPQSFPNRVATLDRGIKWTDAGFVPVHQLAVDVHQQIAVLLVELLEHLLIETS